MTQAQGPGPGNQAAGNHPDGASNPAGTSESAGAPLLQIQGLSHRFPNGTKALQGISFSLQPGELTLLAGANGSGKTVLMKHLNGLLRPTEGQVLYRGRDIRRQLTEVRRRVGLVFQNPDHQLIGQSVEEELAFGPENLGWPRTRIREAVEKGMEQFRLRELTDRSPLDLSGGEKKRLTLAGVMVMEPEILVLDEPFTGLDWPSIRDLLHTLLDLHRRGTALLLITHDLAKCLDHAGRLMVLHQGRLTADGPPEGLRPRLAEWAIHPPREGSWLEAAPGGDVL